MIIELIGCTGVGKSTLVNRLLHSLRENGIIASTGDQFILKQVKLNWIKIYPIRTLLVDLFTFLACIKTYRKNNDFYRLVFKIIHQLPASISLFEKMNIMRNTFKKLGSYEIVRYRNSRQQTVVFDEGTIHSAHYLFVHTSVSPPFEHISRFLQLIPFPDTIIYLQKDEELLIERAISRKHKRLNDLTYQTAKVFIANAIRTFSKIEIHPAIIARLILVNHDGEVKPASASNLSLSQHKIFELIHEAYQNEYQKKTEPKYA